MRKSKVTFAISLAALMLSSCGAEAVGTLASSASDTVTVSPTPAPTSTTPAPTPTSTTASSGSNIVGTDISEGYPQFAVIPPNYDRSAMLQKSTIPADNGVDTVGAFRLICAPSHLAYDDPIVYPGQPGKSHLHLFFGNNETNADSTYKSLRSSGTSTCGLLNRSGYWIPAMLDGHGNVVLPDYATVYYKRLPDSNPNCTPGNIAEKGCIGLPRGLRYVFGRTMEGGTFGDNRSDGVNFVCTQGGLSSKNFTDIAKACPAGSKIGVQIVAASCWDGKNLDTPDHRSQTHWTVFGDDGIGRCPAGYPYLIPTFTFDTWYTVPAGGLADAEFSSDKMMGLPPGSTVHADWLGAWDDQALATWLKSCINGHKNGSGGNLCDGTTLVGAQQPAYGWTNPNRWCLYRRWELQFRSCDRARPCNSGGWRRSSQTCKPLQ